MTRRCCAAAAVLLCGAGCRAYPSLLECANDTATRLRIGGPAIMAGPPAACDAEATCACSLSAAGDGDTLTLTVTTTAAVNFAVRASDGAGALSSTDAALASTPNCPAQLYTASASAPPPPGDFSVVLTPGAEAAAAEAGLRRRLRAGLSALEGKGAAAAGELSRAVAELKAYYQQQLPATVTVGFTDKFGALVRIVTYPPAPVAKYHCKDNTCVTAEDGVDLATCEQLCTAPPPSPGQLYRCTQGQCVIAEDGVDLATCKGLCKAPPPSPGQLYRCTQGQCTVNATGVDSKTCAQMCHPPAQLYRCQKGQCVVGPTGVDLPSCDQMCRAPTPPTPPATHPCRQMLLEVAALVESILGAVADCLTLKTKKCLHEIEVAVGALERLIVDAVKCI